MIKNDHGGAKYWKPNVTSKKGSSAALQNQQGEVDELDSIDNFKKWQDQLQTVMAEQMKDVELSYIDKLANKKAISSNLAKTLRQISEDRFNSKYNQFVNRRGSGEVDFSAAALIPDKKGIHGKTDLSAQGGISKNDDYQMKSKVSYIKGPHILNDPSHLHINTE